MLAHPVFADYMQAYGKGGMRALNEFHALKNLARLYWYTVEFGLIRGSRMACASTARGIVSSRTESIYAVESPSPNRIGFDLERVMRTEYRIDDFQESYFVIESFDQLFQETYKDFAALYAKLQGGADVSAGGHPGERLPLSRKARTPTWAAATRRVKCSAARTSTSIVLRAVSRSRRRAGGHR